MGSEDKIIGYVLIATEVGREAEVAKKILSNPKIRDKITEVVLTYGVHDIVVRFEVKNFRESNDVVTIIRDTEGVRRTETLLGFRVTA